MLPEANPLSQIIRFVIQNEISVLLTKRYATIVFTSIVVIKTLEVLVKVLLSVYTDLELPEYRF